MHCEECKYDYCKACAADKTEERVDTQDGDNAKLEEAEAAAEKEKGLKDQLEQEVEALKKEVEEAAEEQE